MKLRNKKTGNIYTLSENLYIEYTQGGKIEVRAIIPGGNMSYYYDSLDKLNEDWEDYKPVEPLIKDKKIRKAIRAWAEANGYDKLWVYHDHTVISFYNEDDGGNDIIFNTVEKFGLENLKCYTITELCGEEE